jgi:hypothetical protein
MKNKKKFGRLLYICIETKDFSGHRRPPVRSGIPGILVLFRDNRYDPGMFTDEYFIVFPEGDVQEIPGRLSLNDLVDINGRRLALPLPTNRMIVFRVARIRVRENKGGNETYHHLELMSAAELLAFTDPGNR